MKLSKLKIDGFKNLNGVTIDFDRSSPYTVLIGQNGAGKSNVLEALVIIFRALELDELISFRFLLRYKCKQHWIQVDNHWTSSEANINVWPIDADPDVDKSTRISMSQFKRKLEDYLPDHIFGYYSGESRRFEGIFDKPQNRYYQEIIKPGSEKATRPRDPSLRRMFYCRPSYGQLALLAYLAFQDERLKDFLRKHMGIEKMHSALLVLKRPYWAKKKPSRIITESGDPNFWYATGLVRHLLGPLWEHALAPIRITESVQTDYRGKEQQEEHLHLFIQDQETLHAMAAPFGDQETLFTLLETLEISDLIHEVRIWVHRCGAGPELPFHEISDGERQLLTVVGLMKFTGHEESLFLLDEPDTHLNPAWKWKYLDLVDEVAATGAKCHLLLTSHDPLTIAGLEAKQVQVLTHNEEGQVIASEPHVDPRGLGFSGILTDIFGMPSTLDRPTQELVDQRNQLARLEQLSARQLAQLDEINAHLRRLGFMYDERDALYSRFLKKADEIEFADAPPLTPDEIQRRDEVTTAIIKALVEEK